MRRTALRDDVGFTIVESLVAFALLSLLLVSIYSAGGTALRSVDRARGVDHAVLLAESKLAELASMRTMLPAESKGAFDGTPVRWRVEAKPVTANDNSALRLQEVHLELSWAEDGVPKNLAVDTRHLGWANE